MEYPMISLKAARVNANLTQAQAAKEIHIDRRTLQHYESGKHIPNWNVVRRIEEVYHMPADYIIFGPHSAKNEAKERSECPNPGETKTSSPHDTLQMSWEFI